MKRSAIYSASKPHRVSPPGGENAAHVAAATGPGARPSAVVQPASPPSAPVRRLRNLLAFRSPRLRAALWLLAAALPGVLTALWFAAPRATVPTQKDIDTAVGRSLQTLTLPSQAARAYEMISPSVVRVRGLPPEASAGSDAAGAPGRDGKGSAAGKGSSDRQAGARGKGGAPGNDPRRRGEGADGDETVGTGVVIVDTGVILTNLHVVEHAARIGIVFADGTESDASIVALHPEHDLAVLQAKTIPDDLIAATLRSTGDLMVGDLVVAVGFPFGIGPSASSGVVSGLKREYQSAEGRRLLTNLIQFDAAANPGNSGGPLVTAEGEVVGIVTGILSPGPQRGFIGIGFAVPIENAASAVGTPPF